METCPKKKVQGSEGNEWTMTKQKTMRDDERKKRGQHPATTRLQSAMERLSIHETLKTGVRRV
jgi:hypothetical protein